MALWLVSAPFLVAPEQAAPQPRTPIHHLVLLMQANHSFDNYFGTFPGADGTPRNTCQPATLRPGAPPSCIRPFHLGNRQIPDLGHPIDVFRRQLNGGRMNGFVGTRKRYRCSGRLARQDGRRRSGSTGDPARLGSTTTDRRG